MREPAQAMEDWSLGARVQFGVIRASALGFVAGALETVAVSARLQLDLSVVEVAFLGGAAMILMTGVTVVFAVLCAPVLALFREETPRALATHFGAVAFLVCGFYLWQEALIMQADGRAVPAAAVALMPFGFGGVAFFNAAFWLRKLAISGAPRLGWLPVSLGFGVAVVLGTALLYQTRDTGGRFALATDNNVLIITIDSLRRDHVGVYGAGPEGLTPNIDRVGTEGVVFEDVVTPMPETGPAHATLFTGLHPLRHGVISNGHRLGRKYRTVAELLEKEGFATGAFVGAFTVDGNSGLSQGFRTFDDDFSPIPAFVHLSLPRWVLAGWTGLGDPASTPWLYERSADHTVDRFEHWLEGHRAVPFFAWVHLFEPHAPHDAPGLDHRARLGEDGWSDAERQLMRASYADEVRASDAAVGRILEALSSRDLLDETLVIITSDHGENLGEHQLDFHHRGLYDEVVRVPLVMRAPGMDRTVPRVPAQVRLMDLPPTIMTFLGMDPPSDAEGVDLFGYVSGRRRAPMWCALVGRRDRSLSSRPLLGLRNNGVKYVKDLQTGDELLFDVNDDPSEQHDVRSEQPSTLAQARRLVAPEAKALERVEASAGTVTATRRAMLRALGDLP